jgi:GAF domain-containing protein
MPSRSEADIDLLLETAAAKTAAATVRLYRIFAAWTGEIALQGNPESNVVFRQFPEVAEFRLSRLLVVPLRAGNDLMGLLTLGRRLDTAFDPTEVAHAETVARLLAARLERDVLQQKLEERKLVERAKGILQKNRRLSEEQAYFTLRNQSRRLRQSIAEVAQGIIDSQPYSGNRNASSSPE